MMVEGFQLSIYEEVLQDGIIQHVDELIHEFVVRHFVTRVVATMKSFGVTHVISESFFHFLLK